MIPDLVVSNVHFKVYAYVHHEQHLAVVDNMRVVKDTINLWCHSSHVSSASKYVWFLSSAAKLTDVAQDFSTNGTKLNDHVIKKRSVILSHGDILKIPSSQSRHLSLFIKSDAYLHWKPAFKCIYTTPVGPQKKTLFDPTPPLAPVDKASTVISLEMMSAISRA